jgi:hypothetical protein
LRGDRGGVGVGAVVTTGAGDDTKRGEPHEKSTGAGSDIMDGLLAV